MSLNEESSFIRHESDCPAGFESVDGTAEFKGDDVTPVVGAAGASIARAEATGAAVTRTKRPARTIAPTIRKLSALRAVVFDIRLLSPTKASRDSFERINKFPKLTRPPRRPALSSIASPAWGQSALDPRAISSRCDYYLMIIIW